MGIGVLDGASRFVARSGHFRGQTTASGSEGEYNLNLPEKLSFPVSSRLRIAAAIETRDPIIAMRKVSEVTEDLIAAMAKTAPI